jgi:hypothetical protein
MTSSHNVVVCDNGTGVCLSMYFFPLPFCTSEEKSTDWERQLHSARDGAESISWQGFVYQIQTADRLGSVGLCELKCQNELNWA